MEQPTETLAAIAARLDALDVWYLTVAQAAASAAGSTILAMALVRGDLDADLVYSLSQLDESWQIEFWGEDAESTQRRINLEKDIRSAGRLLGLIQADGA